MKKNFVIYIAGRFVSNIGDAVQVIGFPLLLFDLFGSAKIMGLAVSLIMITQIIIRPFFGVIADNLNRKNIMVNIDYISGFMCLFMSFLAYKSFLNLPIILVYLVIQSFTSTLFDTASRAMMPELIEKENYERAYSIMSLSNNISFLLGPVIGTIIYSFMGIKILLLINGLSFLISATSEIFIKYSYNPEGKQKNVFKMNYIKKLKEGLSFTLKNKKIRYSMSVAIINSFFIYGTIGGFLAFFLKKGGFEDYYVGIASSVMTAGSLIGSALIIFIQKKFKTKRSFVFSYLMLSFSFIFFGISLSFNIRNVPVHFVFIAVFLFINSLFILVTNVVINASFQRSLSNEMRARVSTFKYLLIDFSALLTTLVASFLLDSVGSTFYIVGLGIIYLILIFTYIVPNYRVISEEKAEEKMEEENR
jgi:MFS family permease